MDFRQALTTLEAGPPTIGDPSDVARRHGWVLAVDDATALVASRGDNANGDEGTSWVDLRSRITADLMDAVSKSEGAYVGFSKLSGLDGKELSRLAQTWARGLRVPARIAEEVETDFRILLGTARLSPTPRGKRAALISFGQELLLAYSSGLTPVGWSGRWPKGQLVVAHFRDA